MAYIPSFHFHTSKCVVFSFKYYSTALGSRTNTYLKCKYNISKCPLPTNFEVKLHFGQVDWVRVGITFDKEIINNQNDTNCPLYDIYYILEDFIQFYTLQKGWKNSFINTRPLRDGDNVIMTLKNGELRYSINDIQLNGFIKIDLSNKEEMYLLVHARNDRSKCQIIYIAEIWINN